MNVSEVIEISMIMQARLSKPQTIKIKSDLRSNQINLILKKISKIHNHKILENKRIRTVFFWA